MTATVHRWGRFEGSLQLSLPPGADPLRDVQVRAQLEGPAGTRHDVPGFWEGQPSTRNAGAQGVRGSGGASTWKFRFAPPEAGPWRYVFTASGAATATSDGAFDCVPYDGDNPFYRHGPVRVAPSCTHLAHADGTPWFYLADTVWNGPMLAPPADWAHYVATRKRQGFTAAQYVTTQWRTAPDGGPDGPAYHGGDRLERVNPALFQRLDARLDALVDAGIAGVPVLLWAIRGGEGKETNPGNVLSEEDCALLASYQVARWHAHPVVFILNGDGKYVGDEAARWRRIGRAVFGHTDPAHRAPTMVHPGGQTWVGDEFKDEAWLDVVGYQSGHGDDEKAWRWIVQGPPATEWPRVTGKVVMNIESPYEDHLSYQSKQRHPAIHVRRANYWSLTVSPTAGVTYGGHGVWGWDPGGTTPTAHPYTGVSQRWSDALRLPGAEQMRHLRDAFESLRWWDLRPAPELLRAQPGDSDVLRYVTAARTPDGREAICYLAAGGQLQLDLTQLADGALRATWLDPRDGSRREAGPLTRASATLAAPDTQDWVLILHAGSPAAGDPAHATPVRTV
jgi:hypothetical protein